MERLTEIGRERRSDEQTQGIGVESWLRRTTQPRLSHPVTVVCIEHLNFSFALVLELFPAAVWIRSSRPSMDFTLEQLQAGNWQAWDSAHRFFYRLILAFFSSPLAFVNQQHREDVASEAIIRLMPSGIDKAKSLDGLKHLAFEIASNVRVEFVRKWAAAKRGGGEVEMVSLDVDPESENPVDPPAEGPLPNEACAQAEEGTIISMAVDEITGTEGQVLREHVLNGLSQSETAAKLGLNEKTIGVYKQRGLEKLQKILKEKKMV